MSGLLLGIDVGTLSSKGVLVEADGTLVRTAVVEHEMSIPHPGRAAHGCRSSRMWPGLRRRFRS
jgi:xylulokinase